MRTMSRRNSKGVQRDKLKCRVQRLEYDFASRTGHLYMPPGNCPDMSACIDIFEGIDVGVRVLYTVVGDDLDVAYLRQRNGWVARRYCSDEVASFRRALEGYSDAVRIKRAIDDRIKTSGAQSFPGFIRQILQGGK